MDKKKGSWESSGCEKGGISRSFANSAHMAKELFSVEEKNGRPRNFALSPLSIDLVLYMLAAGLQGSTLEQMLKFLGSESRDEILSKSQNMMDVLDTLSSNEGENDNVLCMVNGIWVDEHCPLIESSQPDESEPSYMKQPNEPSYMDQVLIKIFKCDIKSNVKFLENAIGVVDEINSWANDASKGLIKNLVPYGVLNKESGLFLANALYFKGMWDYKHKFSEDQTCEKHFYTLDGEKVSASFMTSVWKYHCKSFDTFKVLKIPYQERVHGKFSMYFFLPESQYGLPNLLEELSGHPQEDYFNLEEVKFEKLLIPKFDFSYNFDVAATLKKNRFPSMEDSKDFSKMVKIRRGVPNFATNMFQKVVIKVDEKGTEAAAVTRSDFPRSARSKRMSFVADHPFMFMIKEENSGLIFFMGSVLNPSL
ncbi:hypothetical protein Vadar_034643 [Vaccinium darrowii]|uniref:Uncharacterized protein n=1 Tax=Vaccinium darrowii TaxID=229202 RepID=A0ACB7YRX2_9ERIC|nr:hypothetical protein Vadar_034643 [Vaccinium darrowii]